MPHILSDLKITEVSSVDRGAGDGVRIVFMKKSAEGNDTMQLDMIKVAKAVIGGRSLPVTRSDFFKEIEKRAGEIRQSDETTEQAFARYATDFEDGRLLLKAHTFAAPDSSPQPETVVQQVSPSMKRLLDRAEEIRKDNPKLTKEQAFAKAYEDPTNRLLVNVLKREQLAQTYLDRAG